MIGFLIDIARISNISLVIRWFVVTKMVSDIYVNITSSITLSALQNKIHLIQPNYHVALKAMYEKWGKMSTFKEQCNTLDLGNNPSIDRSADLRIPPS